MKFILFLEGATEEKGVPGFINRWLNQFFTVGVGVQPDTFEGWPDLHDSAPKKAARYLTDARSLDVIAVVSLLDLYGPTFYPPDKVSVSERYALFPDEIRQFLEKQPKAPETVNFQTPPGKLLEQQYIQKLKRRYSKTTNARNFLPRLDTEAVVSRCPYLKAMLYELRAMALNTGVPPKGDWHQEVVGEAAPERQGQGRA